MNRREMPASGGLLHSVEFANCGNWGHARVMPVLRLKADIRQCEWHVR